MIFVGDVAIAPGDLFVHRGFPNVFRQKKLCVNLEGAISTDGRIPKFGTCNSSEWQEAFSGFPLAPVFLANNHIADIPNGIENTRTHLKSFGMVGFGAGADAVQAARTAECDDYVLLAFGWSVIGCHPAGKLSKGANRLEGKRAMQQVQEALAANPGKKIVVIMHWNYEFELYPQPGHRKLAMELIDMGVYAVVGHHPHIVAPVERYRGRTIAYSLGNWAFSYGKFFDGKLRFPESSFHQMAIELGDDRDSVHHARFEPPSTVSYLSSERVDAQGFSLRPVFEAFDNKAYLDWFKKNRIKRKALPIYKDANSSWTNRVRDEWVSFRQLIINASVRAGIKSLERRS